MDIEPRSLWNGDVVPNTRTQIRRDTSLARASIAAIVFVVPVVPVLLGGPVAVVAVVVVVAVAAAASLRARPRGGGGRKNFSRPQSATQTTSKTSSAST